ncbi:MAG: GLEYA domain-containing protein [Planctomycetota bacterium]|nr:GLEYA domain-containing protein [Planctomycetota bacterium]
MNKNRAPFGVLLVSVLLAALSAIGVHAPSEAASWWNDSYRYRRQVVIIRTGQRWAKAPAAWAKFHCAGALRDDANDVRVVTSKGKLVKSTVKGVGPGDEVLVVYEAPENEDEYYIYYGNPDAQPPAEYNPERGLLLETRRRVSGDPDSWKQMQDILKRSDFVYGRGYVDKVFDGYNHFGPVEDYISIYRGWLMAPKTGTYTFCTASDDASFMFVNDKLVCKWPGYHPANAGAWVEVPGADVPRKRRCTSSRTTIFRRLSRRPASPDGNSPAWKTRTSLSFRTGLSPGSPRRPSSISRIAMPSSPWTSA